jgi:hypothetical protein
MPLRILLASLVLAAFAGCSSVQTQKAAVPLATIQSTERLQLMVRTGDAVMDKLVYEMAYQQFGGVLPLREKEPYTGTVEITFASSAQSAFIGTSSTSGSASAYGSGWYTGRGYTSGSAYASGHSTTVTTGSTFQWQNSTMIIVIKKADGERLWSADYGYKGGWELSGWVVNTPEEAARLVTKRLKEKFLKDFR